MIRESTTELEKEKKIKNLKREMKSGKATKNKKLKRQSEHFDENNIESSAEGVATAGATEGGATEGGATEGGATEGGSTEDGATESVSVRNTHLILI